MTPEAAKALCKLVGHSWIVVRWAEQGPWYERCERCREIKSAQTLRWRGP